MKKIQSPLAFAAVLALVSVTTPVLAADTAATTTTMTATAVAPFTFTTNMTVGSTGSDVLKLEQFLNKTSATAVANPPFAGSPGKETSAFGPKTQAAVEAFQKLHGLPQTGVVGVLTRAAMNQILEGGTATPPVAVVPVPTPVLPTASITADTSVPGSAILTGTYDGAGANPTIWFAYGATPSSMTVLSAKVVATKPAGMSRVTVSNLGTGDCYAAMFVQNSIGTTESVPVHCAK